MTIVPAAILVTFVPALASLVFAKIYYSRVSGPDGTTSFNIRLISPSMFASHFQICNMGHPRTSPYLTAPPKLVYYFQHSVQYHLAAAVLQTRPVDEAMTK